jgi:hypothetical protein
VATTSKDHPAAKKTQAKTEEAPYADQAAALADDTRELAEGIQGHLDDLTKRITELGNVTPGDNDGPTADGVRRLPTAVAEVQRTVQALVLTAADLTRQATS